MKIEPFTREMIIREMFVGSPEKEGKFEFVQPRALSLRDDEYSDRSSRFTASDAEHICEILTHPPSKIFTKENVRSIRHYELVVEGKEYCVGSAEVQDVLLEIYARRLNQNEVLYDAAQLLSKHDPKDLELKIKAYDRLVSEGFISITSTGYFADKNNS